MKYFSKIYRLVSEPHFLFFLFLVVLIVPNLFLVFTEGMSLLANVCNVLVPFACYWFLMTLTRKPGKMLWGLFLFVFFGAFQLVLLYLFGNSIIAVDMLLNLTTTNSSEAMEVLDNLVPAIVGVCVLYLPALVLAVVSICRKEELSEAFLRKERRLSLGVLLAGLLLVGGTYKADASYRVETDLYPLNVCYNVVLAGQRQYQSERYQETSAGFTFQAKPTHAADEKEIVVLVIGETSRALNWGLYGYDRNTTPRLAGVKGLTVFKDALTQSNTTHKSVPILLSAASAEDFNCLYHQKGIVTAFKEAGYHTAFFSNQRPNYSFIDFFGEEADTFHFIKDDSKDPGYNPGDDELLELVKKELAEGHDKLFVVLHTYGSHFNYKERYPKEQAVFTPDDITSIDVRYREDLVNAYDNTIRYTDRFLAELVAMIDSTHASASMLYTSDHGEDIMDDSRNLFLHASPIPSYYQLHVPYIVWMSDKFQANYPFQAKAAAANSGKALSSNTVFHTVLDLGGVQTPYRKDSLSVVNPAYRETERLYLNDHNRPISLKETKIKEADFEMFRKMGIRY